MGSNESLPLITGTADQSEVIEETPVEEIAPITEDEVTQEEPEPEIEVTPEDCQMLYGVAMETLHSVIGTRKGKGHRELPEERRIAQGNNLYQISKRYNIKIPTELELVIFGGAIIADWSYMSISKEEEPIQNDEKEI